MRLLVLGPDAAFGRGAPKDTPERMRVLGEELGFEVVQVEPLDARPRTLQFDGRPQGARRR